MSDLPLTLQYRPKQFSDMVGQGRSTAVLRAMVRKDKIPPALIFGGTRGSGKTSAARILAAALNCTERDRDTEHGSSEPCGECAQCKGVWGTNSTSVLEVDAASSGGIDDVRKLRDMAMYSHDGLWRVVLLDEAHSMSKDAFNALLKTLEEPPPRTVYVLLTTEVHKIPDTIRSRAMSFEFRRIQRDEIVARLAYIAERETLTVEDDLLQELARQARGGLRDAVMLLEQVREIGISKGQDFREWFGVADSGAELVRVCLTGDLGAVATCCSETVARTGDAGQLMSEALEVLRDVVVLRSGGNPPCLPQQVEERLALASSLDPTGVSEAMRVLWQAGQRLRYEDDQILAAQVIGVLLAQSLHPAERQPIPTARDGHGEELSLSEMMSMAAALTGG